MNKLMDKWIDCIQMDKLPDMCCDREMNKWRAIQREREIYR